MPHDDLGIRADELQKRFGTTSALAGVDLAVPAGTVHGLLGPNGAGKTTAVRILSTLLAFDAGRAEVAGSTWCASRTRSGPGSALTGQYAAVDEILSGRQNLVLFGRLFRLSAERGPPARGRAAGSIRSWRGGHPVRSGSTPAACAGGSTSPPA